MKTQPVSDVHRRALVGKIGAGAGRSQDAYTGRRHRIRDVKDLQLEEIRENSIDLKVKIKSKDGREKMTIEFPE